MKRLFWLMCLCCLCPLAAVGCGDDSSGDNDGTDGGASIDQVNHDVKDVTDRVDQLDENVDGLNTDVDDLGNKVGDLTDTSKDLEDRIGDLEDPSAQNCSASDQCVPDGIKVIKDGLKGLIQRMCEVELDCCTADERNYKFGPAIETVDDCVATFNDVLDNGITPNFLSSGGQFIAYLIDIVQAINDQQIQVALNKAGVKECLDLLADQECPKFEEITTTSCSPTGAFDFEEIVPCSPNALIDGLQEDGELCGGPNLAAVPTCKKGLICRQHGSQYGICTPPADVGDRCTADAQCDQALFCNQVSGECQKKGGVGDACAYVDPRFVAISPLGNNSQAQSIECLSPLNCDPKSKKCVKNCDGGAICYWSVGTPDLYCPEDFVCNVTENPTLFDTYSQGVCRKPTAQGKQCTKASECTSGQCVVDGATGDSLCKADLKAAGAACDVAGQSDAECVTGFCNTAKKCAKTCATDPSTASGFTACPKDYYCETADATLEDGVPAYACEPEIENGDPCPTPPNPAVLVDVPCASGYCDATTAPGAPVCAAKLAAASACTRTAECPSTQYCSAAVCTDVIAEDAACTFVAGSCGPDAECVNATCQSTVAKDEDCDLSLGPVCNPGLTCATTGQTTAGVCYEPNKYPDGAACIYDTDCGSTWCNSDLECAKPIAEGKACDAEDGTKIRCAGGLYCKYPADDTAGKCTQQGTAGQGCDPRFGGDDCLNNVDPGGIAPATNYCLLQHDSFVCSTVSVPEGELFCDGPD